MGCRVDFGVFGGYFFVN